MSMMAPTACTAWTPIMRVVEAGGAHRLHARGRQRAARAHQFEGELHQRVRSGASGG